MAFALRKYQLAGITKSFSGLGFLPDPDNEYRWVRQYTYKEGFRCHRRYQHQNSSAMSIVMNGVGSFSLYQCIYRYDRRNGMTTSESLLLKKVSEGEVIWAVKQRLKKLRTGGKKPDQFHMTNDEWKRFQQQTT